MTDTWIDQASPTQNKGSDSNLYVDSKSDSATMRTLVRFTLPTLASAYTLTGANLRLYNEAPTGGRTIDVHRATSTWNENTVTWSSNVGTAGIAVAAATDATAGWEQWAVIEQVQAQYGSNFRFLMRDRTEDASAGMVKKFRSKENGVTSTRPQLVISWA